MLFISKVKEMAKYLIRWAFKDQMHGLDRFHSSQIDTKKLNDLLSLIDKNSHPNINDLWWVIKDIDPIRLNIKNFGYHLGRTLTPILTSTDAPENPVVVNVVSKPTTQEDIESPWFKYWCKQLKTAPLYHRKLWEFAFLLQAIQDRGLFNRKELKGIGFGCGQEPLAAYFASKDISIVVTDLEPEKTSGMGWTNTGQHTSSLDMAYYADIVERDKFNNYVKHKFADMNDIPEDIGSNFDFCWSVCAMEHLGSIKKGLEFVENSLKVLKPGGIAIHTTEYNYLSESITIDDWPTVLFLSKHFEELATSLATKGHRMLGPNFDIGNGVLDRFIDLPPYAFGEGGWFKLDNNQWDEINQVVHLKLAIDGFPCTCFGIIVIKADE
jgi:hypothetical protein